MEGQRALASGATDEEGRLVDGEADRAAVGVRIGWQSGLVLYYCSDLARRIKAATDLRLPDFDTTLSCVVYSHLDRRRECASTLTQGT